METKSFKHVDYILPKFDIPVNLTYRTDISHVGNTIKCF